MDVNNPIQTNDKEKRQKHGGRQAGTPNKATSQLREELKDIVIAQLDTLMVDLALMKPTDRVNAIINLAKFVMPTLKAVEMEDVTKVQNTKKFEFKFVTKT